MGSLCGGAGAGRRLAFWRNFDLRDFGPKAAGRFYRGYREEMGPALCPPLRGGRSVDRGVYR